MKEEYNVFEEEPENLALSMDNLDKKILELLSDDGRKSYRKISRELGVSVGTVHNRVDKLTKTGIINKFVPVINHEKLGYTLTAIIGLEIKGGSVSFLTDKEEFKDNLLAVYDVTGQFDGIVIAKFRNTFELNKFIKLLLKEDTVIRSYTQTVLNIVKEELNTSMINFED
ncbi:Lrp/AsnC family transcriptional regulator [Candidatus Methanosphaera massiliense]|jgi:Lrp/AsnC family transcriptional regulator for asnA, asnC and gidA|uniref:Lrp/AsnC family transcriptional regulator n=1 Tax=Methanosphaera TaxID=2316 RepID=UPI002380ADA3|nr:Lrp/AsnC family transcriptional regulator [Candidatus Methanosphaera massiliense]MDD6285273.1 Lrp/AsnC family transcriptional regulator [Methanobacteriaceae archaeon]MDE4078255.1 Lrp/AsnC family transcriptional regulator [Candidatus Methanosphaera massiliense]MDY2745551.1 Lrp/AsnC family transcriptional regulator [Methanosphaera sp.]